jgi:hypothetical protein
MFCGLVQVSKKGSTIRDHEARRSMYYEKEAVTTSLRASRLLSRTVKQSMMSEKSIVDEGIEESTTVLMKTQDARAWVQGHHQLQDARLNMVEQDTAARHRHRLTAE